MSYFITKSQLEEWAQSPVTSVLLEKLKEELDETYKERSDMFISGDALKTQEVRSNLIGQELVYSEIIDLLSLTDTEILNEYIVEEWLTKAESIPPGTGS